MTSKDWKNCKGCGLCETRTQVVWGKGKKSDLMLLGEAPEQTRIYLESLLLAGVESF